MLHQVSFSPAIRFLQLFQYAFYNILKLRCLIFFLCAPSNIFLSLFYAGAASSQQRLRLRYFVTADNSIMTRGGTSGNCRKCQRNLNRCGTSSYPANSSKHPLPRPENVAQKKLALIERLMGLERVNMGRIYGRRHLQMFSHPSGVSFSSPPSYCLSSLWVLSG